MSADLDHRVRLASFQWLRAQVDIIGEVLPRALLAEGFRFQGARVPLVGPSGIWKPRILEDAALSIATIPGRYDDGVGSAGLLSYAYQGSDASYKDNRWLRTAMQRRLPLIYFYRLVPNQYLAAFPVFVVGDHPAELKFDVAVDDPLALTRPADAFDAVSEDRAAIRREYITSIVRRRVHQQAFRARVIEAYRTHCALCRLRHQELLDAAHITADSELTGEPVVSNGLSLCKLHHAAFDRHFLTVRPDFTIEVRRSILEETDGPMLIHGLQGLHDRPIYLPRETSLQPDRDRLEERYAAFVQSSG